MSKAQAIVNELFEVKEPNKSKLFITFLNDNRKTILSQLNKHLGSVRNGEEYLHCALMIFLEQAMSGELVLESDSLSAYIFGIAKNRYISDMRTDKRRKDAQPTISWFNNRRDNSDSKLYAEVSNQSFLSPIYLEWIKTHAQCHKIIMAWAQWAKDEIDTLTEAAFSVNLSREHFSRKKNECLKSLTSYLNDQKTNHE